MVQEKSDEGVLCKTPLGYRDGKQLDGLITLQNYTNGGHEILGVKVLVCVKSIGGRKKCEYRYSKRYNQADRDLQSLRRKAMRPKKLMSISLTTLMRQP